MARMTDVSMIICRFEQINNKLYQAKMDHNLSHSDDNYEMAFQPSPSSMDQTDASVAETPGYSTMSADSFAYCRSNSETSAFSEHTDDHSYCSEVSPSYWPVVRPASHHNPAVLSRLGMKQHTHCSEDKLEDHEPVDPDLETMKERFAKLLLGEDMSGSGKGVCTQIHLLCALCSYCIWPKLEIGASESGEEGHVEKRNGLSSIGV